MNHIKFVLIISFYMIGTFQIAIAQSAKEQYENIISRRDQLDLIYAAEDLFWKEKENEIYKRTIPEKWQGESSVTLEKLIDNTLYKNTKNFYIYSKLEHEVTKIMNAAALEDYSTFYFPEFTSSFNFYYVGIKIIKADGTEKKINIEADAITVKQDGKFYKKIAISNLEVGDIIDYFKLFEMRTISEYMSDNLDDNFMLLVGDDPILNFNLNFNLSSEVTLNAKLANLDSLGFKKSSFIKDETKFFKYNLELKNIEDYDTDIRWLYPYVELPNLRYQLFINENGHPSKKYQNIGGDKQLNQNPNNAKLETYLKSDYEGALPKTFFNEFKRYLIAQGKSIPAMEKKEIVLELFYFYRAYYVITNWEYTDVHRSSEDIDFINRMKGVLDELEVPNAIVMAFNKQYTSIDKYILTSEITPILQVKLDEPIYLCNPTSFLTPNEIYSDYQGTKAFLFDDAGLSSKQISLPETKSNENGHQVQVDLSFEDGLDNLKVARNFTIKGSNKESFQYQLINQYQYVRASNEKFDIKTREENTGKKQLENLKAQLSELYSQRQKEIDEYKLQDIEDDYGFEIKALDDFKILHFGNTVDDPNFVYADAFTVPEIAKKVGPNYIVPIGLFLGGQVTIEQSEREREYGIYRENPSEYAYNISMTIPEGYEITELENLNFNVENTTGKFIAKATVEGNVLKIITQKVYHHYSEPKENWVQMMAFLDAAYNFTQQKVLIRKKQ